MFGDDNDFYSQYDQPGFGEPIFEDEGDDALVGSGGMFGDMPGWSSDEYPDEFRSDRISGEEGYDTLYGGTDRAKQPSPFPEIPELHGQSAADVLPPLRTQFARTPPSPTGFGGPLPPQQMRYGEGQRPGIMGNLTSLLGMSPQQGERFSRALAAGFQSMGGPGALAAFGRGFGASMRGSQGYDTEQRGIAERDRAFGLRERELGERMADRRESRDMRREEFYGRQEDRRENRDLRRENTEDRRQDRKERGEDRNVRRDQLQEDRFARRAAEIERRLDRKYKPDDLATPEQKAEIEAKREREMQIRLDQLRRQMFPNERQEQGAPGRVPTPRSKQEYDAIPPGELYQHPQDPPGKLRRKGDSPPDA